MNSFPINVSIVIPCFNGEKWINQAIDSALAQEVPGMEVIIVNDGSTDRTRAIAEQYGSKLILINQANSGVSRARREGVRKAHGKYIKLLDADDILPINSLSNMLAVAASYPGEAILGRVAAVDYVGRPTCEQMYSLPLQLRHGDLVPYEFLLTQPTSSGGWLVPRDAFDDDKFFDDATSFGEEFVFCLALVSSRYLVRACDAVVYHARQHESPGRLSRSASEADHLRQCDLMRLAALTIENNIPCHSKFALEYLARLSWSRGRDSLRVGCVQAATAHFQLSQAIFPRLKPVGSPLYRTLCRIFGPFRAEKLLSRLKGMLRHGAFP